MHAEVTFRHAGVAISLISMSYEIASVLPHPRESFAMTSSLSLQWEWIRGMKSF